MLERLQIHDFTVFAKADFKFSKGLNIIVGTNGTGKSHVLKLGYVMGVASTGITKLKQDNQPEFMLPVPVQRTLRSVFQASDFWALKRNQNNGEVRIDVTYSRPEVSLGFTMSGTAINEVVSFSLRNSSVQLTTAPLFIPAKEVLSFYEGFAALYRKYNLAFDQTYLDLCEALSGPTLREPGLGTQAVLATLEHIMQGRVVLESGRFYLYPSQGERREINLAAEGIRKFATLAQLLANGSLSPQTTLFWDEPEANLNPSLLKELAKLLFTLAGQGFQIVLATHSLFLLKEFYILSQAEKIPVRYFGLFEGSGGATQVETTDDFETLEHIAALDAELEQTVDFQQALDHNNAN
jgi:predicted ATPase